MYMLSSEAAHPPKEGYMRMRLIFVRPFISHPSAPQLASFSCLRYFFISSSISFAARSRTSLSPRSFSVSLGFREALE